MPDNDSTTAWGGLDTGLHASRLTVIDENHEALLDVTLPSDARAILEAVSSLPDGCLAGLAAEASSTANHLARDLEAAGLNVTLYEVGSASRYLRARRNKTDANDARGLAELAKLQLPSIPTVHQKTTTTQMLRAQLVMRHQLNRQRVACEAMMRSHMTLQIGAVDRFTSKSAMDRSVRSALSRMKCALGIDMGPQILPLLEICVKLRKLIDHIGYELEKAAKGHPVCSRFLDVPGVGPICAVSFFTAIEDPHRFTSTTSVGAYFGLAPRVTQSGESLRHGRISRMGNSLTRSHLCTAASMLMDARMPDHPLKQWGIRLAERTSRGKAKIAVARRLAVILLAIWQTNSRWDPALAAARPRS